MSNDRIIAQSDQDYLTAVTGTNRGRMTNLQMLRAKRGQPRRKTMKTMLLAAAAALSLGIGSAYADSEGGQIANTQFTSIPGFLAQAPAQNAPAVATAQNGRTAQTYATQSSHGTWLFPPHAAGGNG
jgi:hypothetical protein